MIQMIDLSVINRTGSVAKHFSSVGLKINM